ncbi:MAG: pyridoxamine 5'-phosphate oxidase family protein [bacterium]
MTQQEVYDFVNKNPVCAMATSDGGKPYVREMMIYRADRSGMVFHTGVAKDVFKQLQNNPNVEFCFVKDDTQVRISGTAVLENDLKLKEEIVTNRPFLKPIVDKYGYEPLAVFRVQKMSATVWTMATNLAPKKVIQLQ